MQQDDDIQHVFRFSHSFFTYILASSSYSSWVSWCYCHNNISVLLLLLRFCIKSGTFRTHVHAFRTLLHTDTYFEATKININTHIFFLLLLLPYVRLSPSLSILLWFGVDVSFEFRPLSINFRPIECYVCVNVCWFHVHNFRYRHVHCASWNWT